MPIYEFKCSECEEIAEARLDPGKSIKKCPACGELKLKRIFSVPTLIDTYSPMHPRRGRGKGGAGRIDPGQGQNFSNF